MTPGIKPLVAGNWKMNGTRRSLPELDSMAAGFDVELQNLIDLLVCVPATLLQSACEATRQSPLEIGAQDCHMNTSGAHTGDISAEMIADCGATAVLAGHSERRSDHGETSAVVKAKAEAALQAGLTAIVCIGETGAQRKSGETLDVLAQQLAASMPDDATAKTVAVAYEPVWAIGTGLTPTPQDVRAAHQFIREQLGDRFGEEAGRMRLLYGGSVKAANAAELMAIENVDGALVGGASLMASDFLVICTAYRQITAA